MAPRCDVCVAKDGETVFHVQSAFSRVEICNLIVLTAQAIRIANSPDELKPGKMAISKLLLALSPADRSTCFMVLSKHGIRLEMPADYCAHEVP